MNAFVQPSVPLTLPSPPGGGEGFEQPLAYREGAGRGDSECLSPVAGERALWWGGLGEERRRSPQN